MQVKEIKAEGLSHELEITVPAKDIETHTETRLKEVGKTVRLPGFRPGKVPLNVLKKRYGRTVMGEVLERVVQESAARALGDKKLRPAMQPQIAVKEYDEGKDLIFAMEFDILPEFTVMDLKDLKLEKPVADVAAKEIDDALQRIAGQNASSKPISEDRVTKEGDIVVIDFHGRTKDDGKEHPGMHAHGHKLELGSGQFIPGFEEQLIGKKAGEKVEVNVQFPEEYGAAELAGREAVFDVDIEAIHEPAETEIDEDFAKGIGFDSLQSLRDAIEQQISSEYGRHSRMKLKRALLDALDEKHDFDIPQKMLDAEYEGISKQIEQERKAIAAQNPDDAEEELSDEEREELKTIAIRRVRLGLVLADIGNKNNISVTNPELQQAVVNEARNYPGQEKMVFDFYQKNPQALEGLRAPLFEDKVVDYILAQAEVTEKKVTPEELTAEDPEEGAESQKPAKKKKASAAKKSSSENKTEDKPEKKTAAKKAAGGKGKAKAG